MLKRRDTSGYIAYRDSPIIRVATQAQAMHVRVIATHVQDRLIRCDATVDFRRKHEADIGIGQRDQMRIRCDQKISKLLHRHGVGAMIGKMFIAQEKSQSGRPPRRPR